MQNKKNRPNLEYLFHPKSVAIVGVSSGQHFLQALLSSEYKGKIYPVGRGGSEIFGFKIYPRIKDIPDTVDHVIVAIPAQLVPQLITDCSAKGVKTIHIFAAGFSEIEDEGGKRQQVQVVAAAQQAGIRIIGPNCMGLYCPKAGLAFGEGVPKESGPVGFSSQSGGNSVYAIDEGAARGIYFSKVISYGNACDLDETDFLEYLTHDPETKIIALYIEGVKDGRSFLQALRQATKAKPVIVYKGGITESGVRAAASHTATISGQDTVWRSLLRQAGAIQVDSMDELLDIVLLFRYMPPPKGRNAVIIGAGGGVSVHATDTCSKAGLIMPLLPTQIRQGLKNIFTTEAGGIFRNPVDMGWRSQDLVEKALKIISNWDQIHLLVMHMSLYALGTRREQMCEAYIKTIINLGKERHKPIAVILRPVSSLESTTFALEARQILAKAGFPVYFSVSQAANALGKFIQYHQNKTFAEGEP